MSNEIGVLFDKAQRMARATGLSYKGLEKITNEDRSWIRKFLNNDIQDPGSKRLESFCHGIALYNRRERDKRGSIT